LISQQEFFHVNKNLLEIISDSEIASSCGQLSQYTGISNIKSKLNNHNQMYGMAKVEETD